VSSIRAWVYFANFTDRNFIGKHRIQHLNFLLRTSSERGRYLRYADATLTPGESALSVS